MLKSEENKRHLEPILISLSVIMIIVSAFIIAPTFMSKPEKVNEPETIQTLGLKHAFSKLSPILNITVMDSEGNIKGQEIKEDDLILTNFIIFLKALFTDSDGDRLAFDLKDTGGSTRTFRSYGLTTDYFFNDITTVASGGSIGIGNGTTSPARSDYALDSMQESWMGVSTPSFTNGNVSFAGTVSMTGNYSASEIGFLMTWTDSNGDDRNILMFRDIYTPIPVTVGDQLFATYTLFLNNTGLTNNFGLFLTALFQNTGSTKTFNMTDIGGLPVTTFYIYQVTATATASQINYAVTARSLIAMSSQAGFFPRDSIRLQSVIGSYLGVAEPSHNTSAIMITASQSMPSTGTMNSAGYFVDWKDTSQATTRVMLWASNFTALPHTFGYAVTVAFKLVG